MRENEQGIPLSAANRNYKDPNHKPELVYALTFYKAMNGFRPIEQIVALFREAEINSLNYEVDALAQQPNGQGLQAFFSSILSLEGEKKEAALNELHLAMKRPAKSPMSKEALQYSSSFCEHYTDDIGLFAPLMLNTIELAPGEAMFLHAETPHAYVQGTGLEIMANSDNVLRAGLTPKYIDVPELIDNTVFEPIHPQDIRLTPTTTGGKLSYPIPVEDFGFEILTVIDETGSEHLRSAEILFCIEGEVEVSTQEKSVQLKVGESVFVSHEAGTYRYQGRGSLARAFN
ncbi:mannose-6-phosphate isomerase [Vibrio sp. JCM 19236]|nr:mannose-6-phosphate isomerase [Vibrio sp. JCM 19236]